METLERYAELRAAIELGGDRDRVLEDAGLARADWLRLERRWLEALIAAAIGDDECAARYVDAFEIALTRLSPGLPAEPSGPQPSPASSTAEEAAPSSLGGNVTELPSYLQPASLPAIPAALPRAAALLDPREGAEQRISTGTVLDMGTPLRPAIPFQGGQSPAAPHPRRLAETALPDVSAPTAAATPFLPPEPEALGFTLLRYAELVTARDDPGADRDAVLRRFGLDAAAHAQVEAYWQHKFARSGVLALEFGRLSMQAKAELARKRTAAVATPAGLRSTMVTTAPVADAAPDPTAISAATTTGAIDQYARLVALLRRTPDAEQPTALARLGLTVESRRELEAAWAKRMASDPALREHFLAVLARHLAAPDR